MKILFAHITLKNRIFFFFQSFFLNFTTMTTITGNFYLDIFSFLLGFFIVVFKDFFPFNIIWKYFRIFLLVFFGTLAWRSIKKYLSDDK